MNWITMDAKYIPTEVKSTVRAALTVGASRAAQAPAAMFCIFMVEVVF
jgi:hypothetical protein